MADQWHDFHFINEVVLPGDVVAQKVQNNRDEDKKLKLKLGPGLKKEKDNIVAYKCGVLREKESTKYKMLWIDSDQKRVFIQK